MNISNSIKKNTIVIVFFLGIAGTCDGAERPRLLTDFVPAEIAARATPTTELLIQSFTSDPIHGRNLLAQMTKEPGNFKTLASQLRHTSESFEGPKVSADEIAGVATRSVRAAESMADGGGGGDAPEVHTEEAIYESARVVLIDILKEKMLNRIQDVHGEGAALQWNVYCREGLPEGPGGGQAFDFIIYLDQEGYGYVVPTTKNPSGQPYAVLYKNPAGIQIRNTQILTDARIVKILFSACDEENARRKERTYDNKTTRTSRQERRAAERTEKKKK